MDIYFFHDGPMYCDKNGNLYSGFLDQEIIDKYLAFGENFILVTRVYTIENIDNKKKISNKNVKVIAIPNTNTIYGRVFKSKECNKIIRENINKAKFIVTRLPSRIGFMAAGYARRDNKKYLVEVVGCPRDSLWNHSWKGKILAPVEYGKMRRSVKNATYVVYVTNSFLQKRYPTDGKSIGCSDVILSYAGTDVLKRRNERIQSMQKRVVIGTCGTLDVKYKGQEYVIKALSLLKNRGFEFEYQLVGIGRPDRLIKLAEKENVLDCLSIIGSINHDEIDEWMDELDIYIQPSNTEGLCRALVEALNRACPCIASNAGGNIELLDSKMIFERRKYKNLAEDLLLLLTNKNLMREQAERNYLKAKEFNAEDLKQIRGRFFLEYKDDVS